MVVIIEYLFKLKHIWKDLTNSIQLPYGCLIFIKYWYFVLFSLELVTYCKSYYLIELSWIHYFRMWLTKVSLHQDINHQLVSSDFHFTALPILALIRIIIRAANNLLRFIFTTSFGDEYNFLSFRCEDPFIVFLNVSWRPKWFS